MKMTALRLGIAAALILGGWSVGRAQSQVAEFEMAVDAPGGVVIVRCLEGCDWQSRTDTMGTVSWKCETNRCAGVLNGRGLVRVSPSQTTFTPTTREAR